MEHQSHIDYLPSLLKALRLIDVDLIKTKTRYTNKIMDKYNLEVERINSAFSQLQIKLSRTLTEKLKITLSDIID